MNHTNKMPNSLRSTSLTVRHQSELPIDAIRTKIGYPNSVSNATGCAGAGRGYRKTAKVPIHVTTPKGRQFVGSIVTIGQVQALQKTGVNRTKHFFRKYNGYGIALEAITRARELGVVGVRLVFTDGAILHATFEKFDAHGIKDQLPGFEAQVFLELRHWHSPREARISLDTESEVRHEASDSD